MNNQSYDKQWYQKLNKPPWTPPDYTFGIIWPILYTLMFISLYLVYKNKKCYPYCNSITLFILQFLLNIIWTTIFFKFKMLKLALLDLVLLIFLVILTIKSFYKINKLSAILLLPYIIWLFIAFSLNLYIVIYN